jgi:membrane protein DedA with SNARE-associated domain
MAEMLISYIDIVMHRNGLLAIFILMAMNGFFSAPPSEFVLPLAGLLALGSDYTLIHTLSAAIAGNLFGTFLLYIIGRKIGYGWLMKVKEWSENRGWLMRKVGMIIPSKKTFVVIGELLRSRGAIWIGIFRCFPYVRSIISIPAGMAKMPLILFFVYSAIGIAVWAVFWQGGAFLIGYSWLKYGQLISWFLLVPLVVLIIIAKRKISRHLKELF